jgi:hypothetical protein
MKNLPLLTLTVLLILVSCRNSSDNKSQNLSAAGTVDTLDHTPFPGLQTGEVTLTEESFGKVIDLTGEQITTNQIFKIAGAEMLVKDSIMIMKNNSSENQFSAFRLPDFKLLKWFGKTGRGPDEFQYTHLVPSEDKSTLCFIYEMTNSKLYKVDLQLNLTPANIKFEKKEAMFDQKQLYSFGDNDFFYAGNTNSGKSISRARKVNDSLEISEIYNLSFSPKHRNWANYIGDFGANQAKGRLVYAYKYFKRLVFMDTTGTKIRVINFQAEEVQKKEVLAQLGPDNVTHYWGMSCQPDYVYVLYSGRTPIEVSKQFKQENFYIFVEQFDWNGNPVRKFKLDHWGYFCVDEKSRSLYIASVNDDEPMFRFELNEGNEGNERNEGMKKMKE